MKAKRALIVFLVFFAMLGGINAHLVSHAVVVRPWWGITTIFLSSAMLFYWYYFDSDALGYSRSRLLNIGISCFSLVAVPYYLVRSRPKGRKIKALLKCCGFLILISLSGAIGGLASAFIG